MRIARIAGRLDVGNLKNEIDADEWARWQMFTATEPDGWVGLELVARRLGWLMVQTKNKKKIDERKFGIKLRLSDENDDGRQRVLFEMAAIRSQIRERLKT